MSFIYNLPLKQAVFIHIPKTGGKSISKGMLDYNPHRNMNGKRPTKELIGHLTLKETLNRAHLDHIDYLFFASVRNPWDRAVSFFHYVSQKPFESGQPELGEKISRGEVDFRTFIEIMSSGVVEVMRPQYDYIQSDLGIDVSIIRNEFLQGDLDIFLEKGGIIKKPHIPHINKSSHDHYSNYYDNETVSMIREYEHKIIEKVGYEFR